MNNFEATGLQSHLQYFFEEDDLNRNFYYSQQLPSENVTCMLKFKESCLVSGLPFFFETFNYLLRDKISFSNFLTREGKDNNLTIEFDLPFNVALTGERIALNLLQRSTSISTLTKKFTDLASPKKIDILDTRKTTPGLRFLEKYAVVVGGGKNHRFGQSDMWMIKDNHKTFFGGVKKAVEFFRSINSNYTPLLLEVHSIEELVFAKEEKIRFVMLDNFSPQMIKEAISLKESEMNFEVSGNIKLENISNYLIEGVDAISIGSLTSDVPRIDLSMKMKMK